jgi:hypothetical protein
MTLLRRAVIALLAVLAVGGVAGRISSASSATPTTFSVTVAGIDSQTLDPHFRPMFDGGGGVRATLEQDEGTIMFFNLEVGVDLPVGAKVTSVAISARTCLNNVPVVFGSDQPTTGNAIQNVVMNVLKGSPCRAVRTATKTGNPITTTVAGRRYVVDARLGAAAYPNNPSDDAFMGATIKYTCTAPCVP